MIKINSQIDALFPADNVVVFFHAHVDDESFLSAGIINELVCSGRKCVVVYAAASIVNNQQKTFIRQNEALKASQILGPYQIVYLNFCELKYFEKSALRLVDQNIENISENLYETLLNNGLNDKIILVSYDKNGGYGNVDHKIVHEAGKYFAEKNVDSTSFFYEITISRDRLTEWLKIMREKGENPKFLPKLSYWSNKFGLTNNEITYYYELTEKQLKLKRKALIAHKSQIASNEFPISISLDDFKKIFGYEFFRELRKSKTGHFHDRSESKN